jgi:hypothetical protein
MSSGDSLIAYPSFRYSPNLSVVQRPSDGRNDDAGNGGNDGDGDVQPQ